MVADNPEDPENSNGLEIEEIDSVSAPKRLRSRPRELSQIDHEEDNRPPPKSEMSHSGNEIKGRKNLQHIALGLLAVLLLANLFLIYELSSINGRLADMSSGLSGLSNNTSIIMEDVNRLNEKVGNYQSQTQITPPLAQTGNGTPSLVNSENSSSGNLSNNG